MNKPIYGLIGAMIASMALPAISVANTPFKGSVTVPPEITTAVELSNTDINRIVCPGTMNDLIFSQEKGLDGHFSGNNAFVKFKITKKGEELIYSTTPSELFVVCNNVVYTLIATPKEIPAVTVRLAPATGDKLKKNISHFRNLPLEKRALQLIREAYSGEYPSGYKVAAADVKIDVSTDFATTLYRVVDVEGVGLRLKEFQIKPLAEKRLTLDEKMFLTPNISETILAIAMERHNIEPGTTGRVFVVEQKEN